VTPVPNAKPNNSNSTTTGIVFHPFTLALTYPGNLTLQMEFLFFLAIPWGNLRLVSTIPVQEVAKNVKPLAAVGVIW
jgi:hypothetical protein